MEARSAWVSSVWGKGDEAEHERRALKQGEEACCICLTNAVEVKFKPCNHDVCLECCNRMRAANVFKADAGIKCALCRQYIEMYTDLNGNPSSVPSLRAANQAAAKSKAGRAAGADAAVSTSVPNPSRLVPPVTARPDPTWYCDKCRHLNTGNKPECSQCRCKNPNHVKPNTSKDPLNCLPEEIVKSAKERNHPNLNRAFTDAGMPWAQGKIGGTQESVKLALRTKGHERLLRVVKVLTEGENLREVALDLCGNYTVQTLLEATHRLRGVAHTMAQQGHLPHESFSSVSGVTAATAFGLLLRVLASMTPALVVDQHGVHCLVKVNAMAAPSEVVLLAQQMVPEFLHYLNQPHAHALLYVTTMVERLTKLRSEGGPHAQAAASLLASICSTYCANQKNLMWSARNPYAGPMAVNTVQGALPAPEAFKVGWSLATSAASLSTNRNGCRTLELLCSLRAADARCGEMARDLVCYTAKALQGGLAETAMRREEGGDKLVRVLLQQLQSHREDDWVEWIITELVMSAEALARDRDGRELLTSALSMPTLTSDLLGTHMRRLRDTAGPHYGAIQQQVQSNRSSPDKLPRKTHAMPSEINPFAPPDVMRKFPHYLRDAHAHHPHHSMLPKHHHHHHDAAQAAHATAHAANVAAAGQPPPPPPPRPSSAQVSSPVKAKVPPPGFGAGAANGPANGSLSFPNGGPAPPMPQPYSAAAPSTSQQQQQQQQQPRQEPPPPPLATVQRASPPAPAAAAPAAAPPAAAARPVPPAPAPVAAPPAAAPPPGFGPAPAAAASVSQPQTPAPPTPASQPQAPVGQAVTPAHPSDPAAFFPKPPPHPTALLPHMPAPSPALLQQQQQPPPPTASARPPPPPLGPAPARPAAAPPTLVPPPPLAPAVPMPGAPAAAPAPAAAAPAAFGGFGSLQEMLASMTMGAEPAPVPAPATAAASRPAAPRPGGGYRPVGLSASASTYQPMLPSGSGSLSVAAPSYQPPYAAGGLSAAAPAYQAAHVAGGGLSVAAPTFQQPRQAPAGYGYGMGQPPAAQQAPRPAAAAPVFSYMQQQAALPQQPAALFHPAPAPRPAVQQQPAPQQAPQQHQYAQQPAAAQPPQQQGRWSGAAAAAPASAPAPAADGGPSWACKVCTYKHEGKEAHYLACALCGAPQT